MHSLSRSLIFSRYYGLSKFYFSIISPTGPRHLYRQSIRILFYSTPPTPNPEETDVNERIQHMSILKVDKEPKSLTRFEKVVQTGKDVSYSGVILVAFAMTGLLIWGLFSEFFSRNSINSIFSRTLKLVRNDDRVQRVLGEPIRGFGEETGWNRRRGLDHVYYKVGESDHLRMEFNAKGQRRLGRVKVDLKKDARGRYQVRYLLVELQGRPAGTVIVQDNR